MDMFMAFVHSEQLKFWWCTIRFEPTSTSWKERKVQQKSVSYILSY